MRLGAAVHSASPAVAERPHWLYMGSKETSVCRLRQISSTVGRGANQSCGLGFVLGDGSVSSEVGESVSMESPVVKDWMPVSDEVWCTMEGRTTFGRLAYGSVDKLACRVVAANLHGLMVQTFPCYVGARVGFVT